MKFWLTRLSKKYSSRGPIPLIPSHSSCTVLSKSPLKGVLKVGPALLFIVLNDTKFLNLANGCKHCIWLTRNGFDGVDAVMLAAYELPLAGPGALPGGVGGPAPGALALAAPPTTELHLVGVGVGVAPSAPGLLLCKGHFEGHKEMPSVFLLANSALEYER